MNLFTPGQSVSSHWPSKLWKVMKLTFWLAMAVLPISAKSFSQRVTITCKNDKLANVFEHIKQQTGRAFIVDKMLLDKAHPVTLHEKDVPLSEILNKCLADQLLTYEISNNVIVVTKLQESNTRNALPTITIAAFNVTGIVRDSKGIPLERASVLIKKQGYQKGSISDASGAFLLTDIPQGDYILEVSLLGYGKYTAPVHLNADTRPLDIRLSPVSKTLDEMVIVAYGKQKKADLTGAISTISTKDLENRPITNLTNALQGTMAGVTVTQNTGQPGRDEGSIKIRGIGTLNNSNPMVVVDGLISSMSDVNPGDIASISVLKDAASAAIYGSRAANGVVIITTKKGKKGHLQVRYEAYAGKQKATRLPDFLPSWQQASFYNEALKNEDASPKWSETDIQQFKDGSDNTGAHPNTDWLGLLYKGSGLQQNHYLSLSGSDEKTQYLLSLGYFDQEGIIKGTNSKKYTVRVNISSNIGKRATVFANLGYLYSPFQEPVSSYPGSSSLGLISFVSNQIPNTVPYKYANGYYGYGPNGNPIASLELGSFNKSQQYTLTGNAGLDLELLKGLHFKPNFGYRLNINQREQFVKDIQFYDYLTGRPTKYQGPNNLTNNYNNTTYTNLQAILEYERTSGLHYFKVMTGASQEQTGYRENSEYRERFLNNAITEINAGPAAGQTNKGLANAVALRSYFGRINYDFDKKYLVEATLRYDGSSRFAPSKQWGLFPSVSGAWNIAKEKFFEPASELVNELKLRATWGKLGNQNVVGNYPAVSIISPGQDYSFDHTIASGIAPVTGANPDITWETATTKDFGLDASLMQNKLSFSAAYFIRNTTNILLNLPIGAPYSLSSPYQNAGAVSNKGWEFTAGYKGQIHAVHYSINANATLIKNTITDLKGSGPYISGGTFQQVGYPIDAFYGYISEGIFQTPEQVAKHAVQSGGVIAPGDIMYKDINNDGKIDGNDRTYLGSYFPKMTFGGNITVNWNNFDIGIFLQGASGVKNYAQGNMMGGVGANGKPTSIFLDRWTDDNHSTTFPRLWFSYKNNSPSTPSSFWIRDASYLRLKNLQIGYNLPTEIIHRIGLQNVKVYYSGQNLLTFSKFYKWVDPEAKQGEAGYSYPQVKINTLGINITL